MANPISHAIGMLGHSSSRSIVASRFILIYQWDPTDVLDLMAKEGLSAGGGARTS